jgi:hypothetical protein
MKRTEQEGQQWRSRIHEEFGGVISRLPKRSVLPQHARLKEMAVRVTGAMAPLVQEFQHFLHSLPGEDLGTPTQKKALVDEIQLMMNLLHCRCECPKCGAPSSLRFRIAGAKQEERFDFRHGKGEGRGSGSCTSAVKFPVLILHSMESPERNSDPSPSR